MVYGLAVVVHFVLKDGSSVGLVISYRVQVSQEQEIERSSSFYGVRESLLAWALGP